jgi:hypothetical protein
MARDLSIFILVQNELWIWINGIAQYLTWGICIFPGGYVSSMSQYSLFSLGDGVRSCNIFGFGKFCFVVVVGLNYYLNVKASNLLTIFAFSRT